MGHARPVSSRNAPVRFSHQQRHLLLPGKHRLDREFWKRLHPRQNGQREALRYEKLRRFRAPGYQQ